MGLAGQYLLDGETPPGFGRLCELIELAGNGFGFPAFLRTGLTSGKHRWNETCFLTSRHDIPQHVANLVEYSELADFIGLATDVWVVRELLPTKPLITLPAYGDMPVCREFRVFVKDGKAVCSHGYWPMRALIEGCPLRPRQFPCGIDDDDWSEPAERIVPDNLQAIYEELCCGAEFEYWIAMAEAAGAAVGGSWSVDVLQDKNGKWYVTDMAEAGKSFHMEDCPHAVEFA